MRNFQLVKGGFEMDGSEIAKLDKNEIIDALDKLKKLGCDQIAISSVLQQLEEHGGRSF